MPMAEAQQESGNIRIAFPKPLQRCVILSDSVEGTFRLLLSCYQGL